MKILGRGKALLVCSCLLGAGAPAAGAGAETRTGWLATIGDGTAWRERAHWRLAISPYSAHFRPSADHRSVWALALERQRDDGWLAGASRFSNSFGQPSAYIYLGRRFEALGNVEPLFGQLSAGLLYGYRGRFEDKVPLNNNGFSPGALAGLGWHFGPRASAVAHLLGDGGVMLQLSWDFR